MPFEINPESLSDESPMFMCCGMPCVAKTWVMANSSKTLMHYDLRCPKCGATRNVTVEREGGKGDWQMRDRTA